MAIWDDTELTVDAELTRFDRRMPQLAQSIKGPSGASAYDGKRQAAKDQLRRDLRSSEVLVADLQDLTQLQRAATFLELSLIYRDMADRNDTISSENASYYLDEYKSELNQLSLDLVDGTTDVTPNYGIRCFRQ
jgi:hypothetical protein